MHSKSAILAIAALLWLGGTAFSQRFIGLNPTMDADTSILDIDVGPPFSSTDLGATGMPSLSGLDFQPATGVLYASGGNTDGGNLYTVDVATTSVSLVGATGFAAVPGLAFDLDFTLYGTAHVSGPTLLTNGLITIDAFTGAGTMVGTFGMLGGSPIRGIDAIAIHPFTDVMYGVINGGFDGTPDEIFTIDETTGAATLLGRLSDGSGRLPPAAIAGLAFDAAGNLFGSLGGGDGRIVSIDLSMLTFTILGDAAMGSVSDLARMHRPAVDLGFGKIGGSGLEPDYRIIGDSGFGGTVGFFLTGGPPATTAFVLVGTSFSPRPFAGGTVVPDPVFLIGPITTDAAGAFTFMLPSGGGPLLVFSQVGLLDPGASFMLGLSNAVGYLIGP